MGLFDTTWSLQAEKLLPPILRDCDIQEDTGDFKTGDPENNYIEYIILSSPGHWKEFPVVGVNIYQYLLGTESPQVIQRNILLQLRNDIFDNPSVNIKKFPTIEVNSVTITADGV
jgi:hypothetical protein